jgi:predicted nucleic acid-binding protein
VPALWHAEISNALLVGERRKVVREAQVLDYLSRLSKLPIITDDVEPASRREGVMALARQYGLSAYDATYLDLALRQGAVLATFDRRLAEAMTSTGGQLFEEI